MSKLTKDKVLHSLKGAKETFDITLDGLTDSGISLLAEILTGELNTELEAAEKSTSFQARKRETLASITARQPLPEYAKYSNAMGAIHIQYLNDDNLWVFKDIDFYEIIEAVAKRVNK